MPSNLAPSVPLLLDFEQNRASLCTSVDIVRIEGGRRAGATDGEARARAVVRGGEIIGVEIIEPGSGYISAPTVTFGGGIGATARASIGDRIESISLSGERDPEDGESNSHGSGYSSSSPPSVRISGGGGLGAEARAEIVSGEVAEITILSSGSGYTSVPTVTIASPPGSGERARASARMATGIASVTVTNGGSGYRVPQEAVTRWSDVVGVGAGFRIRELTGEVPFHLGDGNGTAREFTARLPGPPVRFSALRIDGERIVPVGTRVEGVHRLRHGILSATEDSRIDLRDGHLTIFFASAPLDGERIEALYFPSSGSATIADGNIQPNDIEVNLLPQSGSRFFRPLRGDGTLLLDDYGELSEWALRVPFFSQVENPNYLPRAIRERPLIPDLVTAFREGTLDEVWDSASRLERLRQPGTVDDEYLDALLSTLGNFMDVTDWSPEDKRRLATELAFFHQTSGTEHYLQFISYIRNLVLRAKVQYTTDYDTADPNSFVDEDDPIVTSESGHYRTNRIRLTYDFERFADSESFDSGVLRRLFYRAAPIHDVIHEILGLASDDRTRLRREAFFFPSSVTRGVNPPTPGESSS